MLSSRAIRLRQRQQRGISLVELLVGVAVGLFVVAGVTAIAATQLSDNRRLLVESQVQQDLRASVDVIARELRRAGASSGPELIVFTEGDTPPAPNTFAPITNPTPSVINYSYHRSAGQEGPYGFQLVNGVIRSRLGNAGWQDLTDSRSLQVTDFSITTTSPAQAQVACTKLCADKTTNCWPSVTLREHDIVVTGRAVTDPAVQRTFRATVRNRSDHVSFNHPLSPSQACPA